MAIAWVVTPAMPVRVSINIRSPRSSIHLSPVRRANLPIQTPSRRTGLQFPSVSGRALCRQLRTLPRKLECLLLCRVASQRPRRMRTPPRRRRPHSRCRNTRVSLPSSRLHTHKLRLVHTPRRITGLLPLQMPVIQFRDSMRSRSTINMRMSIPIFDTLRKQPRYNLILRHRKNSLRSRMSSSPSRASPSLCTRTGIAMNRSL